MDSFCDFCVVFATFASGSPLSKKSRPKAASCKAGTEDQIFTPVMYVS
jgi:hypothetical protein